MITQENHQKFEDTKPYTKFEGLQSTH